MIIKEGDKGGATVIMNTEFYEQKITSNDPYNNTWKRYIKLLKKHPNELTEKEQDYLTNFNRKESIFVVYQSFTNPNKLRRHVQKQIKAT